MAITSIGYDGSVDEFNWALLAPVLGHRYGVIGAADWRVSAVPNVDRAVSVNVGVGFALGVRDDSTTAVTIGPFDVAVGTPRWDMVVARRNWTTNTTTFDKIKGGGAATLPTYKAYSPGSPIDEQPLALVQITPGIQTPTAIRDLRIWQRNGGAFARDELVKDYLPHAGGQIRIGDDLWTATTADGLSVAQWSKSSAFTMPLLGAGAPLTGTIPANPQFFAQAGTVVQPIGGDGYARLIFPRPFPNALLYADLVNGDGAINGTPELGWTGSANQPTYNLANLVYHWVDYAGNRTLPYHRVNFILIGC